MQEEPLQAGCCRAESETGELVEEHSKTLPESQTTIVTWVSETKYF